MNTKKIVSSILAVSFGIIASPANAGSNTIQLRIGKVDYVQMQDLRIDSHEYSLTDKYSEVNIWDGDYDGLNINSVNSIESNRTIGRTNINGYIRSIEKFSGYEYQLETSY